MGTKEVSILIIGRVCNVKQQVKLVRETKTKINDNVKFYFVGIGEDVDSLIKEIGDSNQYIYLGYAKASDIMNKYDYVCLFSKKEGLPLTLIEACMFGKPLITNDIPAALEINRSEYTGYVFQDFAELVQGCNKLPSKESDKYMFLSMNARKQYEENFTEDIMLSKYEDYIKRHFF